MRIAISASEMRSLAWSSDRLTVCNALCNALCDALCDALCTNLQLGHVDLLAGPVLPRRRAVLDLRLLHTPPLHLRRHLDHIA